MNHQPPRPAIIYCRVSDGKGGKRGDGLRSQETACREFARNSNYRVDRAFHDDITGKTVKRPAMTEVVRFLKQHPDEEYTVLIDSIDRFARDVRGHWDLRDLLREAGGRLASPKMEFKDDADSMMVENIHATFAQHFRQKNAEQTQRRMRARVLGGFAVFRAPVGYKYKTVVGQGQMLKRHEPVASVVQDALERYASGDLDTQADVMRFLQDNPLFPKDRTGILKHQRVGNLLNQPVYAGYVEAPSWGVSLRPGHHEALISLQTYQRIQDRLNGINRAPKRKNLNEDFPLRGYVICADCGTPLTACWSTGSHARHPYYLCPKRGCASYGKSIRRDRIEGEFETLLQSATPSEKLFRVVHGMFRELWDRQFARSKGQAKALAAELARIEQQTAQALDRILDASLPSVISAFENRIQRLETDKLLVLERMADAGRPKSSFDLTLRAGFDLIESNLDSQIALELIQTVCRTEAGIHVEGSVGRSSCSGSCGGSDGVVASPGG